MIDLNSTQHKQERAVIDMSDLMDDALEAEDRGQRNYLGASAIGEHCSRKIQYQMRYPEPFKAQTLRIFERGHQGEERAIRHIRLAGFDLQTHKPDGKQLGFQTAGGRYRGHVDGVFKSSPIPAIKTPCLWEHKEVGDKGFKSLQSRGVQKAYPHYYDQLSQYMAYLDLLNPAVFMATNANTQERYIELVKFDKARAQAVTDKAVNILKAEDAGELLPRPYADGDGFGCRFCAYKERCWA